VTPSSQADQIVRDSTVRAISSATAARQRAAELALGYYDDHQLMVDDLTETYEPLHQNRVKWRMRPKVCIPLLVPIVDALCGLYRESPKYSWGDGDEQWSELFGQWKSEHLALMQDVDKFTLISGTNAVRPMVPVVGGPLELALYTNDQLDYIPADGNPAKMAELDISFKSTINGQMGSVEQRWNAVRFVRLINGKPVPRPTRRRKTTRAESTSTVGYRSSSSTMRGPGGP
jgi:hypothetical protein